MVLTGRLRLCGPASLSRKRQIIMMTQSLLIFLILAPAADPPRHVLEGGGVKLTIDLPDATTGYYRGTRFD